jgi:tetratricopeptide (TPR) repeat protein/tRNA A-37 threonylcarbamoyl transferase component Bud32/TolB-like protein
MKTFSPGLSDSIASVIDDPRPCPHCDSSSHIAGGLCVGCLLEAGLDPADESADSLDALLSEINLPDQNWRLGNYEILEEIGRGGMGVIYRARQRHSRRIVAVKRILSYHSDSRETLARFRREAQAAASLDHPNILPIYEVSESEDGLPFFSMKFAPGGTLQQVASALRNDPRQCVALVAKIARAVQYAHSRGILHRDLKPGNILLDGRGEPLVSDFGLAKWLDTTSDLTRTLTIFGTPGYIAPEQATHSAAELKPTADIYSLGAILFDLLAGRPPFLGAHALSVIRQASESTAPKLRSFSKLADRDLETICSRCLDREPTARYRSAHDLAEDLERWLEGRPIIARPISPPMHVWRWARRNRLITASFAGCALVAVLALGKHMQSIRLASELQADATATHSVTVMPFLDLDAGRADPGVATIVADQLGKELARSGPSRVLSLTAFEGVPTTGSLNNAITEAGRISHARTILTGTKRLLNGKLRLSFRLFDVANGNAIFHHLVVMDPSDWQKLVPLRYKAPAIYALLSKTNAELSTTPQDTDPGLVNDPVRELILAGQELQNRGTVPDFDRAIECFHKAVKQEPKSAVALASLSLAYANRAGFSSDQRFLEKAITSARQALELDPENAEAHRALAGAFYQNRQYHDALEHAFLALEFAGFDPRPVGLIGTILQAIGEPNRALAWYELQKHGQIRPADGEALLGDCWTTLGEYDNAETAYRRAWELHPERPQGWIGICRLRLLQRDFAAARKLYQENLRQYTDSTLALQMAAEVEFFARNYRAAEMLYEELSVKDPTGGGAFYGRLPYDFALGWLRFIQSDGGSDKEALRTCLDNQKQRLETAPRDPDLLYRLAATESALGEVDAALKYLRSAFEQGCADYRLLAIDPRFDAVRAHKDYVSIVQAMVTRVEFLRQSRTISSIKPQ